MDNSDDLEYVHDGVITKYVVDFKEKRLKIYFELEDYKEHIVEFVDYLAHNFNNVIAKSIILEIEEITVEEFINDNKEFLKNSLRYNFPIFIPNEENLNDLKSVLEETYYKVFVIYATTGLEGFIIAKDAKIK